MKKYLFYIGSMQLGGANRVMANLCNYFSTESKVILINDILPEKGKKEYLISEHVERIFLDEGFISGNKNLYRIRKLRKIIKKEKPDIIISFMGPPNTRMLLSTFGLSVKKVISVRNDPYREYGYGLWRYFFSLLFCFADGCVFQTKEAANYFPKMVRKKAKVIFNPVNEKFFNTTWKGIKKEIVCVGRLTEQKNPILAIEAFIDILKSFPKYKLSFYGDGEMRDFLIEMCHKKGLDNKVNFYGQVDDIEKIFSEGKIYFLTSDYEGMPNALMEAMAVGIPVIATDCPCGGPRSLIRNQNEGILVPCRDSQAFVKVASDLLMNESKCKELSYNEKERSKKFLPLNILTEWKKYLDYIGEA